MTNRDLARQLDFGETPAGSRQRPMLRLARAGTTGRLSGPDKYKVLDARRRKAQIAARRLLDLIDAQEGMR